MSLDYNPDILARSQLQRVARREREVHFKLRATTIHGRRDHDDPLF
jgi:hypothetical protein